MNMWLAWNSAEKFCLHSNISKTDFESVKEQFEQFRIARKRRSPMACFHEEE